MGKQRRRIIFVIAFVAALVAPTSSSSQVLRADDPQTLVQSFYDTYPDRLSGGLPRGEELAWLGTFVTARLHEAFFGALEYQQDWIKRNPDRPPYYLKPPLADGVSFTGFHDAITGFAVGRAEFHGLGTWHVPVHFWSDETTPWEAHVIVKEQRGRYVIDDFLFLPTEPGDDCWLLSSSLMPRRK